MKLPEKISICEVLLRDGLQSYPTILTTEQKIKLFIALYSAGIRDFEIGSFVNPRLDPQLADTDDFFTHIKRYDNVNLRALAFNLKGLERAATCGAKQINVVISASEQHQFQNTHFTKAHALSELAKMASFAAAHGIRLSGSIATAFACPFGEHISTIKVAEITQEFLLHGIYEISLTDTAGIASPNLVYSRCSKLQYHFPQVKWKVHFRGNRENRLSNVLSALKSGINEFDTSLGGFGCCSFIRGYTGNVTTEELHLMCQKLQISTQVQLTPLKEAAKLLHQFHQSI